MAKEMFIAMDKREKDRNELNPILIMSDSGARGSAAIGTVVHQEMPCLKCLNRIFIKGLAWTLCRLLSPQMPLLQAINWCVLPMLNKYRQALK